MMIAIGMKDRTIQKVGLMTAFASVADARAIALAASMADRVQHAFFMSDSAHIYVFENGEEIGDFPNGENGFTL
jgi:hypothetical protein